MNAIDKGATQVKEIVGACMEMVKSLGCDDEKEKKFCLTVIGLVHQYLFQDAPQEAKSLMIELDKL